MRKTLILPFAEQLDKSFDQSFIIESKDPDNLFQDRKEGGNKEEMRWFLVMTVMKEQKEDQK